MSKYTGDIHWMCALGAIKMQPEVVLESIHIIKQQEFKTIFKMGKEQFWILNDKGIVKTDTVTKECIQNPHAKFILINCNENSLLSYVEEIISDSDDGDSYCEDEPKTFGNS